MNDYLIKKHRKSIILDYFTTTIIFGVFHYLFKGDYWVIVIYIPLLFAHFMYTSKKILLEVLKIEDSYTIISYSIIDGKEEFIIPINKVIEIDLHKKTLEVWYKGTYKKSSEKYILNAESENQIYSQIKNFKTDLQEFNQKE